ncbi:Uncharacterised protein [Mobiluncus curtisii]|uniref:Uncharacterized protein n=1 Tax=Mobiluncus curtisii TaxID=2051 RepID=A0A2X2YRE2_9ACTO|nr:Uncharacterised protein [Mobiluncus curtisii]
MLGTNDRFHPAEHPFHESEIATTCIFTKTRDEDNPESVLKSVIRVRARGAEAAQWRDAAGLKWYRVGRTW